MAYTVPEHHVLQFSGNVELLSQQTESKFLNAVDMRDFYGEGADYAGAEYLYLFDGQAWFFMNTYKKNGFEEVEINLKKVENNC